MYAHYHNTTMVNSQCIYHSKNRNVVMTYNMLFQLNVGHKDATVALLEMLFTTTSKIC